MLFAYPNFRSAAQDFTVCDVDVVPCRNFFHHLSLSTHLHDVFDVLKRQFGALSSAHIDKMGNRFEMFGIHAGTNATKMIQFESLGYWASMFFIHRPVCIATAYPIPTTAHESVSVLCMPLPHPTRSFVPAIFDFVRTWMRSISVTIYKASMLLPRVAISFFGPTGHLSHSATATFAKSFHKLSPSSEFITCMDGSNG